MLPFTRIEYAAKRYQRTKKERQFNHVLDRIEQSIGIGSSGLWHAQAFALADGYYHSAR